jgi:hypothetical protein
MDADTCVKVDHGAALDLLGNGKPANRLANVDPHAAPSGVTCGRLVVALGIGEVLDAEHGDNLLVLLIG